jgi:DNA helicase-2/ATP-dependent DNA helicase PcrA
MVADDLLKELNSSQQEVARTTEGPVLVLAGAGTGKTRCIIYRTAYLIASGKVRLEHLLIVTFTNKAARELRQRLADSFGLTNKNLWVGTFHSIFNKILRFEAKYLPFSANFVIYDENDQKTLFRQIYKSLDIDPKKFIPRAVRSIISHQKNNIITPDTYWDFNEENLFTKEVFRIYKRYQEELLRRDAMDFDDILVNMALLLDKNSEVREKWQNRFHYIMIDEYQDTNYVQFKIINYLAQKHQNLCVVGDDDQAIYTWRGATIKNILNFEKDYQKVKTIKLERNYRSHQNILALANSLIKHNSLRHEKELFTDLLSKEMPRLLALDNENEEALFVAEEIMKYHQDSLWQDCAILYRTNAQSRALESVLVKKKIPYQIFGGVNFFQRKEIKDVLCFLRLLSNPADTESLIRALDLAKGIGKTTSERILEEAKNKDVVPFSLLMQSDLAFLSTRAVKMLTNFQQLMHTLAESAAQKTIQETIATVIDLAEMGDEYGISQGKKNRKVKLDDPELISRQENLLELLASARAFSEEFRKQNEGNEPDLTEYLNSATLQTDLDTAEENADKISLMTMHNAKGLEFKHVFIIGLEDGLLPHARSIEEDMSKGNVTRQEEERRLLYVGITRARQTLTLTLARWRRGIMGNDVTIPSRFIKDLAPKFLNEERYDHYSYLTPSREKKKPADKKANNVILESQKHYRIGQKIKHDNLGIGEILNVNGEGADALLTIKFADGNVKKIVGNYVEII